LPQSLELFGGARASPFRRVAPREFGIHLRSGLRSAQVRVERNSRSASRIGSRVIQEPVPVFAANPVPVAPAGLHLGQRNLVLPGFYDGRKVLPKHVRQNRVVLESSHNQNPALSSYPADGRVVPPRPDRIASARARLLK